MDDGGSDAMNIFEEHESNVRSYCRSFPIRLIMQRGSCYICTTEGPYRFFRCDLRAELITGTTLKAACSMMKDSISQVKGAGELVVS